MRNNNVCARYNFDIFTNTLTISKEFEKRASIPGSIEQLTFCQFMTSYGNALVVERYEAHQVKKGLTFKQMEVFISKCRDAEKRMKEFQSVKEMAQAQTSPYKYVKTWFLDNYANYSEKPEFDEEGFVILKTKAQMEEENRATKETEADKNVSNIIELPVSA